MLEKILEKIEKEFDRRIDTQLKIMAGLNDDVYRYGYGKSLEAYQQGKLLVEDIIRKHMNDGNDINVVAKENDGWIPVEKRLPEGNAVNPITRDAYVYSITVEFGGITDVRYYSFFKGHWYNQSPKIMDDLVIAWKERPKPYMPEKGTE